MRRTWAGLFLIVAVVTGCGGDDDDADTAGDDPRAETTAPPDTGDDAPDTEDDEEDGEAATALDCPLTEADVSGVFGTAMTAMAQERVGSGCGFESVEDPIGGPQAFFRQQSALALESFGPEFGGEIVDGLGDESVYLDDDITTSAVVRIGDFVFELQVIDVAGASDETEREHALALAEIAVAAL